MYLIKWLTIISVLKVYDGEDKFIRCVIIVKYIINKLYLYIYLIEFKSETKLIFFSINYRYLVGFCQVI